MCSESWSRGDKDWVVLCTTAGCCCCCYRRRAVTPPPPPTLKYFLRTLQIFLVSCTTLPKFQACVPHTAVVMRVNDTGAAMKLCAVWPCCLLLRSEGRGERWPAEVFVCWDRVSHSASTITLHQRKTLPWSPPKQLLLHALCRFAQCKFQLCTYCMQHPFLAPHNPTSYPLIILAESRVL